MRNNPTELNLFMTAVNYFTELFRPSILPVTIEQAIASHLDIYHHWLKPQNSVAFNDSINLYVTTMKKAPRDAIALSKRIDKLKLELADSKTIFSDQRLLVRLEALQTLRALVQSIEAGQ